MQIDRRQLLRLLAAAPFAAYLDDLARELERAFGRPAARRRVAIRFALQFTTWRGLAQLMRTDREIVDLVLQWIASS